MKMMVPASWNTAKVGLAQYLAHNRYSLQSPTQPLCLAPHRTALWCVSIRQGAGATSTISCLTNPLWKSTQRSISPAQGTWALMNTGKAPEHLWLSPGVLWRVEWISESCREESLVVFGKHNSGGHYVAECWNHDRSHWALSMKFGATGAWARMAAWFEFRMPQFWWLQSPPITLGKPLCWTAQELTSTWTTTKYQEKLS